MKLVLLCLLISLFHPHLVHGEELGFWQLCQNGATYLKNGDYNKAETAYKTAILYAYDDEDIENVHINLASIYTITGRFKEALNELLLCSDDNLQAKIHLSNVYLRMGEYNKSISCLNTVITKSANNIQLNAIAYQNAGYTYWQMHNYEKAKEQFEIALPHLSGIVKLASMGNYAIILAKLGLFLEAIKTIDKAISLIDPKTEDHTILLRKKAEILLMHGNRQEAYSSFNKFYTKEKSYALSNFLSMTEQNRLDFWKTLKPNISKVFALENDYPDFLLDVALFRREVAMVGNANLREINNRLNINGKLLRESLKEHEVAIDFIRYLKNDTARYGVLIIPSLKMRKPLKFISLWTEDELHGYMVDNTTRLDEALCSNNMEDKDMIYSDTHLASYVWDGLNEELEKYDYEDIYFAPDGLLNLLAIEYLREDNGVCLHRMTSLSKLLNRDKQKISFKKKMLAAGGFNYDQEETGEEITDSIFNHDAMDFLQSQLKQLVKPFSYLKSAKIEIDSISNCSPFVTDTTTIQTEQQLKKAVNNKMYNILHLSTHGYALEVDVPIVPEAFCDSISEDRSLLTTGIALTSANVAYKNEGSEDGIISAREFCEMDMSNIDLLVLSACQTGLGRFSDEGPAGLVRGLKKAGVGSLIVSLWSVSDEATMLFMKHLYNGFSEQSSPDIHAAFNAARMNFSTETKQTRQFNAKKMKAIRYEESYNQPRYCNSFILIDAI